jgi:hypothetical protein
VLASVHEHEGCSYLRQLQGESQNLRNEVVPVLLLLETTEGHLGARNVLLGVLEVLEEGLLVPLDALLLVGVGVRVAVNGTSLAAEETVESRADLVAAVLVDGVALGTTRLEEVGTLLEITTSHCEGLFGEVGGRRCVETERSKELRRVLDSSKDQRSRL